MSEKVASNLLFFKDNSSRDWKICKIHVSDDKIVINQVPNASTLEIFLKNITSIKLLNFGRHTSMILIEYKENAHHNDELVIKLPEYKVKEVEKFLSYKITLTK